MHTETKHYINCTVLRKTGQILLDTSVEWQSPENRSA